MTQSGLTVLNTYRLRAAGPDFRNAVTALAARVRAEGHAGVLSYRFFVNETDGQGRAVIDYADAAAWIGHHQIAMDWPEMKALHAAATLEEVVFLGEVSAEIKAWLAASTLTARIVDGFQAVAGFRRMGRV